MAKKTTVQAYAIHKIGLGRKGDKKQWVEASTKARPSVFDIDEDTFGNLEKAGAVRKATKEEIALSKLLGNQVETDVSTTVLTEANVVTDETEAAGKKGGKGGSTKPPSGADGDPQSTPKGAATKADDSGDSTDAKKDGADADKKSDNEEI